MYNFEEEGGLQITTGSDLFSLGIGPIHSVEADSYFETFKQILEDMCF